MFKGNLHLTIKIMFMTGKAKMQEFLRKFNLSGIFIFNLGIFIIRTFSGEFPTKFVQNIFKEIMALMMVTDHKFAFYENPLQNSLKKI